jgi:multidrug transporter EmrE-like cation transporter
MTWTLLLAIVAEVVGTLALKASDGFSRWVPVGVMVVGYGIAFSLLAVTLTSMEVGRAYAVWAGLGTAGAAIGGVLLFGDQLSTMAILGIVIIVSGVVVLNLAGAHA